MATSSKSNKAQQLIRGKSECEVALLAYGNIGIGLLNLSLIYVYESVIYKIT